MVTRRGSLIGSPNSPALIREMLPVDRDYIFFCNSWGNGVKNIVSVDAASLMGDCVKDRAITRVSCGNTLKYVISDSKGYLRCVGADRNA